MDMPASKKLDVSKTIRVNKKFNMKINKIPCEFGSTSFIDDNCRTIRQDVEIIFNYPNMIYRLIIRDAKSVDSLFSKKNQDAFLEFLIANNAAIPYDGKPYKINTCNSKGQIERINLCVIKLKKLPMLISIPSKEWFNNHARRKVYSIDGLRNYPYICESRRIIQKEDPKGNKNERKSKWGLF